MQNLKTMLEQVGQPVILKNLVNVEVKIEFGDLMRDAAKTYSMEVDRIMRGSSTRYQITDEEFEKYFHTLLFLRVSQVDNSKHQNFTPYRNAMRNYRIPVFMDTLINSIGEATDLGFGYRFRPSVQIDSKNMLAPSEMQDISDKLDVLNIEGLMCTITGIKMSPDGDLQTMAVFSIHGEILGYKKDHPLFGFYAAFFKHEIISDVLNDSFLRIRYGADIEFKQYIRLITKP